MSDVHLLRLVAASLLCGVAAARAVPVLNEVFYDPAGADGGAEFVELFNPGPAAVDLEGWRLEFANGAVGPVWSVRWRGLAGETLPAGGRYLIADRGWSGPAADAVVSLGLQNGPDAVQLASPDGLDDDRLGYGALTDPALFEDAPHPGVASGLSLARRPDGADSDRNAMDWSPAEPSPGAPNFPRHAATIEAVAWEPPRRLRPGLPVRLAVTVLNEGLEALPAAALRLRRAGVDASAGDGAELGALARAELALDWIPDSTGVHDLSLVWPLDGEELVLPLGGYRVGVPALQVTEVMAAPDPGAPEWIEATVAGPVALDLGDFTLSDADGEPSALPERVLAPGERIVLTGDPEGLLARRRALEAAGAGDCGVVDLARFVTEPLGGWPTLNNTPSEDRDWAERVVLRDAEGRVVDYAEVGGAAVAVATGRSAERTAVGGAVDAAWGLCVHPSGGTPACRNSLEAGSRVGAPLLLEPNPWDPERDGGLRLAFDVPAGAAGWRLAIHDAWGHRRRDLGGDRLGPGARHRVWDGLDDAGRPAPPGAYVVALALIGDDGGVRLRRKALLALLRGGRP